MVGFSQDGTVVTLDLNQEIVDEIIGNAEGNTVNIDITSRLLATETVKPVAALAQIAGAGLAFELSLPQGTALFDASALTSITEQASGETLSLQLNQATRAELTQPQRDALGPDDMVFSINISSGPQAIRDFSGTLTVTLPYNGPLPAAIWYLDGAGDLEKIDSTYDEAAKTISFTTSHLSFYVAGHDTSAVTPPTNEEPQPGPAVAQPISGGSLALLIIIICAAVGATAFGIRKIRARSN